jgi:DNA-binding CsgD family transcriptional regulator
MSIAAAIADTRTTDRFARPHLRSTDSAASKAFDLTALLPPPMDPAAASHRLSRLTPRQQRVLGMVLAGHRSKTIAADLGVSQRTVENHRAAIMKKTGARSVPELVRVALGAA